MKGNLLQVWEAIAKVYLNTLLQHLLTRGQRLIIAIPYAWLILFFFIPFLWVLKISVSRATLAVPPLIPLVEWTENQALTLFLNLSNYRTLFTDPLYFSAFLSSFIISLIATVLCLILGYMIALSIVCVNSQWRLILLLLVILPFWTSFLIRVYAWMGLLSNEGIINSLLLGLGLIKNPLPLLHNAFAVVIAIVYCYLPFMVLPIYVSLDRIDPVYMEAAYDLGCRPRKVFWQIIVPLSLPGIIAGSILVFVPAVGEFVIPELLGGPSTLMIGRIMWMEFFNNRDWPLACTLAIAMLILFIAPILLFQKFQLRATLKAEKGS